MADNDLETILEKLQKNKKKSSVEHCIVIILLGVLVALVSYMVVSSILPKKTYVAGKYGGICYFRNYKSIEKPVYFNDLKSCLEFVNQ